MRKKGLRNRKPRKIMCVYVALSSNSAIGSVLWLRNASM
jgi:hypothetical protein